MRALLQLLQSGFKTRESFGFILGLNGVGRLASVADLCRIATALREGNNNNVPSTTQILHILSSLRLEESGDDNNAIARVIVALYALRNSGFSWEHICGLLHHPERTVVTVDEVVALQVGAVQMLGIQWNVIGVAAIDAYPRIVQHLRTIQTVDGIHSYVQMEMTSLVNRVLELQAAMVAAAEAAQNLQHVDGSSELEVEDL